MAHAGTSGAMVMECLIKLLSPVSPVEGLRAQRVIQSLGRQHRDEDPSDVRLLAEHEGHNGQGRTQDGPFRGPAATAARGEQRG